jgi:hypothetical protein
LLLAILAPLDGSSALNNEASEAFLVRMEGEWQGEAAITPIGPRPYDIHFVRNPAGVLEGAAGPGAATHHWTFQRDGGDLILRFLSTFEGNRQPIWLKVTGEAEGALVFRAREPEFLKLHVRVGAQECLIRVFHHDRLHVEIRLRRPG